MLDMAAVEWMNGCGRDGAGRGRVLAWALAGLLVATAGITPAADGTWNGTPGNWSDSGIPDGGVIADGAGSSASFAATLTGGHHGDGRRSGDDRRDHLHRSRCHLVRPSRSPVHESNALELDGGAGSATVTVSDAARTLEISGILAGGQGFAKAGPGRLALSGVANTVAGTITLEDGSLQVAADASLGQVTQVAVAPPAASSPDAVSLELGSSRGFSLTATITVAGPDGGNSQIGIAGGIHRQPAGSRWPARRPT